MILLNVDIGKTYIHYKYFYPFCGYTIHLYHDYFMQDSDPLKKKTILFYNLL